MSALIHRQTPESAMNAASNQVDPCQNLPESRGGASPVVPTRLQLIHHLVRSGDYHVPAGEIADRMIEQLMISRREFDF